MSNLKIKKISIKDAKPNMILAKDAISTMGIVVIAKNTMLSDINYKKLKDNGINFISIFEKEIFEKEFSNEILIQNQQYEKITDREEFKNFKEEYDRKLVDVEDKFIAIGNGFGIDKEDLYSIVIDVVDKVNCKSDILCYLAQLKGKDVHTFSHCLNVALICHLFGMWIRYDEEEIKTLTLAGLLHDIGKTKIDENIIKKPTKLTDIEYEYIKKHTQLGFEIVKDLDIPEEVKLSILMHHEKVDGSGYPLGLKDERILQTAKIVAICDIYEAMTANRVYRSGICPFEVIKGFEQNHYELLDTQLLLAFLQNIVYTYVGSHVVLSDSTEAEVVFINQANLSRPIVKTENTFIDLSQKNDLYIEYVI